MGITKKSFGLKNDVDTDEEDIENSDSDSEVSMSEDTEDSSDDEPNTTNPETTLEDNEDDNQEEAEEEEDEVIKAIREASTKKRDHPPVIECESFVVDICFHPHEDILGVANIEGDVLLYKYSNDENTLLHTIELHNKACRAIDFSKDGKILFSTSKDKAIMLSDVETCKLTRYYEDSHEVPVYTISVLNDNLFATGDDNGAVKLWDLRTTNSKAVFSLKKNEDYISDIKTHEQEKYLLCSSGDGSLTTIDLAAR